MAGADWVVGDGVFDLASFIAIQVPSSSRYNALSFPIATAQDPVV